jgi:hypothetical protein
MIYGLVSLLAKVDDVSAGGVLTLVFPLVLVFVVAGLWAAWWTRRRRNE